MVPSKSKSQSHSPHKPCSDWSHIAAMWLRETKYTTMMPYWSIMRALTAIWTLPKMTQKFPWTSNLTLSRPRLIVRSRAMWPKDPPSKGPMISGFLSSMKTRANVFGSSSSTVLMKTSTKKIRSSRTILSTLSTPRTRVWSQAPCRKRSFTWRSLQIRSNILSAFGSSFPKR